MDENKNALVVTQRGQLTTQRPKQEQKPPPSPDPEKVYAQTYQKNASDRPQSGLNTGDEETPKPKRKTSQKAAKQAPDTPSGESKSQENIDSQQNSEFITDKFSENLEKIGDILRTSVTAQNKAVKSDLDKVEKTYSSFINATKEQKTVLEKASSEQQDIFKNLTKQFMSYREDENADAKRFHEELMATLQELHATGGDKDVIASIEGLIRQGLASSKVDPNKEKFDKKWQLSAKEKEHWSYKMFGGEPEKKSKISPEEVAIASGKAEALSKGLFSTEKPVQPEKSATDKMLEAILKNTSGGDGGKRGIPTKIDKLLVSKLVVDKLDERLERKKKDKPESEKVNHDKAEPIRQPDIEVNPRPEHVVHGKQTDVEDVAFHEVPPKPRVQLAPPKPVVTAPVVHTPELKAAPATKSIPVVPNKKETTRKVSEPKLSPMAKAVRGAVADIKPAIEKPARTIPQVVAGTGVAPISSPSVTTAPAMAATPLAKDEVPVQAAPAAEESSGFGLSDLASMVPTKGLGKGLGKALSVGGKLLGKAAVPLAAGMSLYGGIKDEMNGKHVESLSDIVPEDTIDKFNPFSYAVNAGRYVGNKIYKGAGAISDAVGGSGSLGGDIYDALHPAPKVEAKAPSTPNVTKLTEEANTSKQAAADSKQVAPVVVQPQQAPQQASQHVTNYVPVTGAPRSRENHFDRAVGKSFTGI